MIESCWSFVVLCLGRARHPKLPSGEVETYSGGESHSFSLHSNVASAAWEDECNLYWRAKSVIVDTPACERLFIAGYCNGNIQHVLTCSRSLPTANVLIFAIARAWNV